MNVIRHWFDRRKAKPGGKKSSPLDEINVPEWPVEWIREFNELLTALRRISDFEPAQSDLLDRIMNVAMITRADLATEGIRFPENKKDRQPRYGLHNVSNDHENTLL
jgi:hypothetical protein